MFQGPLARHQTSPYLKKPAEAAAPTTFVRPVIYT